MVESRKQFAHRWAMVLAGILLQWTALIGAAAQTERYGQTLLLEHRLPESVVGTFNRFTPSKPVTGESKIVATMLADTSDWVGPVFEGRTSGNPYTLVIVVKGVAKADGDATTLWHSGWRLEDPQDGMIDRMTPHGGVARTGVRAGEAVEIHGPAIPITFKEDRKAAPKIGLVNVRNLDLQEVRVQVWSGIPSAGFTETLLSFRWALVGVVLVVLWWFWFRRT
jgi:hypothetical protein